MDKSERLSRTASVAYTKGLLNNPGENNCFLNSAVQVLWHLDVFRRSFREISGHFCVGESCIFCALKVIFTQIQYSDEAALPPDALRQALAVTFKDQQRFQLQDMDDAAECLENILNRLHFHFAMNEKDEVCSAAHCVSHRKFAMEIMEQSICSCGATSEPLPFSQLVHYVSVSALCHEADVLSSKLKGLNEDMFGYLLKKAVNQGDVRTCPGNCGKKIKVQQSLLNCPDVVCIGLIWDSETPDVEQITQLLDCIDPVIRLPEVFPRVVDDRARKVGLLLAGVVTYYGKHYSTFFKSDKLRTWIYFDDARVRKCGSEWETIRKKCCQNHYQPLLLLYVNPHGVPVNTKRALSEVKLVDTKTLLASQENSRSRSFTNEKTNDLSGGSLSVVDETKSNGDAVDGLLSSSSSHSLGSDRGSGNYVELSPPDRKKSRRTMKKLRGIGSDIKRALSRSRNNSPTREQNNSEPGTPVSSENNSPITPDIPTPNLKGRFSRSRSNSPTPEQSASDLKRSFSRSRNNSPTPEQSSSDVKTAFSYSKDNSSSPERNNNNTKSLHTGKVERINEERKQNSCDDLIKLEDDPKAKIMRAYNTTSIRGREVDEVDSGVGSSSSQASSPATSSVSSVDTTTDDLIDFSTRTFPRPSKANDVQQKLAVIVEEAENLLRRSYALEKDDLALSLSLATNASTRFRIAIENCPVTKSPEYMANLRRRYTTCVDRSRELHRLINEKNDYERRMFSQREKQKLIDNQRGRDQQVLREMKQTPATHGTLPRSSVKDRAQLSDVGPISSRSLNDLFLNNHRPDSGSPPTARRTNSRIIHSGGVGSTRDEVNCTQKIKPDVLCYSPAHYGKINGLNNDLERMSVKEEPRIRSATVTHVSTSFNPVRSPPVDQLLQTSTVLPNSRSLRNTDIRRCSIYDNMPPNPGKDPRMNTNTLQSTNLPPTYANTRSRSEQGQNRSLLQRFNVPVTLGHSRGLGVPEDVRRINEDVRNSRRLCNRCGKIFVEKNTMFCPSCQDLQHMLRNLDNTAMQY
ncbi:inactive ubiquitin carboxyl-terminal hydrolase 54-like isoform X2 [Dendronephthya gigantea]|uniref:inactive ubiquitin carboxyl-terminal hydrolase 54-like isoform X2 n=1 Tax=Dendronephthya gigantea TaxID=151771 RepID=UPI00106AF161|nr:inactive ubiquitin carboxyl-terminal hydrolase 54-like isoform X2 [Dendronephthya gigantea]